MARSSTVTIRVPAVLRAYCDGASELSVSAQSVRGVLEELERRHPALHRNICDETGKMRPHVNLFVNTSRVDHGEGLGTAVVPGDVVSILPAVSGG